MGTRHQNLLTLAGLALASLLALAGWRLLVQMRVAGEIIDTVWVDLPSGPSLLVFAARAEPADIGPSQTSYRWLRIDPATGETREQHQYALIEDQIPRWVPPYAVGGSSLLVSDAQGLSLRDLATGALLDQDAIFARWPQIAAPWHQTQVTAPGELHIEADDRSWWRMTLATGAVTPAEAPYGQRYHGFCVSGDHPVPGGYVWTWLVLPQARHSDPNTTALVRALPRGTNAGLPVYDDITPLGLRVPYARFLCDERTGVAALSHAKDLLTQTQSRGDPSVVALSLLRFDGSDFRSHATLDLSTEEIYGVEAFGFDGGFVVRLGQQLLSLGEDGSVRWQRSL